uniref:Uncharacterized protein LOC104218508 n=1 Tax=Nicotiana sylvestris TaxID=4096 RepID=A0A1U7VY56_NICSY|nr:PREDICTED: uncharacterized protein LOC104218508 [Nicotiana sylvestris]
MQKEHLPIWSRLLHSTTQILEENQVTACSRCNSRKGHKTTEEANMNLMKEPKAPKEYGILAIPLTSSAIKILRSKKGHRRSGSSIYQCRQHPLSSNVRMQLVNSLPCVEMIAVGNSI